MKHIGFDQSTVLNEYAKIAQEKGFFKSASDQKFEEFKSKVSELGYGMVADTSQQTTILGLAQEILRDMPHSKRDQNFKQLVYSYTGRVIASNNQDVKIAADAPRGDVDPHSGQGETKKVDNIDKVVTDLDKIGRERFEKQIMQYKGLWSIYNQYVKNTKGAKSDFQSAGNEIANKNAMNLLSQKVGSTDGAIKAYENLLIAIKTKLLPLVPKQHMQRFLAMIPQRPKVSLNSANNIFEKQADNIYDVSGETGEDLINGAHPGNTRTELTHSKTDENLVETIIEQQEKDFDVARSVPKGTYATLVNLYNQLHKLGHKNKIVSLLNTIKAIATPEDIERHRLVALANKLGRQGKKKEANRVINILKNLNKSAFIPMIPLLTVAPLSAALHYVYQYATRSSGILSELANRLQDLDTNAKTKNIVDGWIRTLNSISSRLAFQQTSEDPKVNAENAKKYSAEIQNAHDFLLSLNQQWIKVKSNLDDWGGEYGDIGDVTTAILSAMTELGSQVKASQATIINAVQKGKEEATGVAGSGLDKKQEGLLSEKDTNDLDKKRKERIRRWQKSYNSVIEGTGKTPLDTNGIKDAATRAAMKDVIKSNSKSLADYRDYLNNKGGNKDSVEIVKPTSSPEESISPKERAHNTMISRTVDSIYAKMENDPGLNDTMRNLYFDPNFISYAKRFIKKELNRFYRDSDFGRNSVTDVVSDSYDAVMKSLLPKLKEFIGE